MTATAAILFAAVGCGASLPTGPSGAAPLPTLSFEAEAGGGQGDRMVRASASGGLTIHLAPGQRREWSFTTPAQSSAYAVVVRYANDETGGSEWLQTTVDGLPAGAFRARDTGDDGAGWEAFVSERTGIVQLGPGQHTLTVASSEGDGCIEIDLVLLSPEGL